MVEYRQEQFDNELKNGVKKFENIQLNKLKYIDKNLEGLRFTNCNLSEVQIVKSNIKDIYFDNCNIEKCSFNESEIDYIDIYRTNIEETDFSKCIISNWEQYCWSEISFKQCNFNLITINSGLEIGNSTFEQCDFTNAKIGCSQLFNCKITNSNMQNAKIKSSISYNNFTDTNLEKGQLEEIGGDNSFNNVNLKDTTLIRAEDIKIGLFKNCNLELCTLHSLIPNNTVDLCGINLYRANLEYVSWINSNMSECNLEEANLIEAELQNANLERANLKNANLKDANLENANLKNVNLEGANLEGTRFEDANLDGIIILEKDYEYIKDYVARNKIELMAIHQKG